jgi:hypothetical protein
MVLTNSAKLDVGGGTIRRAYEGLKLQQPKSALEEGLALACSTGMRVAMEWLSTV